MGDAAKDRKNLTQRRKAKRNEPQMNQPSRKAMAGKLQIYADGDWGR
jgi:hypothetical protein